MYLLPSLTLSFDNSLLLIKSLTHTLSVFEYSLSAQPIALFVKKSEVPELFTIAFGLNSKSQIVSIYFV